MTLRDHERNGDYDDTVCQSCGTTLPVDPAPYSWPDHGFCHRACALKAPGGYRAFGQAAIDLAETTTRLGGPGFERDLVRDWLKGATPNGPPMLARLSADADLVGYAGDSWCWRLWAGGQCHAMRLTSKGQSC